MKDFYATLLLMLGCSIHAAADNWMSRLPDNLYVAQVSIPGAHDAATGNGVSLATFSQCQDLDVASQWALGIRAFDLRPIVKDDHLHINHGIAETELRFDDALYLLRDSLVKNPSEFAVVHLLYADGFEDDLEEAKAGIDSIKAEVDSLYEACLLTESYEVEGYGDIIRLLAQILEDAEAAQEAYEESVPVGTVRADGEKEVSRIYSVTGEQLDAPRRGAVNIVKYTDGTVRKVRY